MSPLAPRDDIETLEPQNVPLAVGTPVRFVKLDPQTRQPVLMGPDVAGGLVHAAVGIKGYVFNPANEVLIADDLPGKVQYTARISQIAKIDIKDGACFITTVSGSVYQVVLTGGEPMIAPEGSPNAAPGTGDHSVSGTTAAIARDSGWTLRGILRRLGGG